MAGLFWLGVVFDRRIPNAGLGVVQGEAFELKPPVCSQVVILLAVKLAFG